MTTLIPTSQQQQQTSAASVAASAPAAVESYEDMFKEITRKLYGEESAHGLYPINNAQVAQLAQTPSAPPEGELTREKLTVSAEFHCNLTSTSLFFRRTIVYDTRVGPKLGTTGV